MAYQERNWQSMKPLKGGQTGSEDILGGAVGQTASGFKKGEMAPPSRGVVKVGPEDKYHGDPADSVLPAPKIKDNIKPVTKSGA